MMKSLLPALLVLLPASATAAVETQYLQTNESAAQAVQPANPVPDLISPAPPEKPAPPAVQGQTQLAPPPGQWVYTGQYGWLWMPYDNAFTDVPANGAPPNMFVYYPSVGWCWTVAPWVWGWGPMPYFGIYGYAGYPWYGYGYGHWYGYRGAYAGWYGGGYWSGGRWYGNGHGYPGSYHYAAPRGVVAPHGNFGGGVSTGAHAAGGSAGHGGGGHR